jgi:hypothetical protein
MLKSDLLRWLEVYAYTYDNSNFLKVYSQDFLMLGMDKTDSKNRCDNYIRDLKIKYNYQV